MEEKIFIFDDNANTIIGMLLILFGVLRILGM